MNAFHTSILLDVNPSLCTDTQHTTHLVTSISVGKYLAKYMTNKSYDDSVKLKRTEMDPFRFG